MEKRRAEAYGGRTPVPPRRRGRRLRDALYSKENSPRKGTGAKSRQRRLLPSEFANVANGELFPWGRILGFSV